MERIPRDMPPQPSLSGGAVVLPVVQPEGAVSSPPAANIEFPAS